MALSEPAQVDEVLALCQALLALGSAQEARRFLADLCTPAEIRALSERWHVARLLDEGKLSYRQISEATGVSTATIVRVARFLRDEPHQGYRAVLDRMKGASEEQP
jgi:TrpR-related protein YerC/YecD